MKNQNKPTQEEIKPSVTRFCYILFFSLFHILFHMNETPEEFKKRVNRMGRKKIKWYDVLLFSLIVTLIIIVDIIGIMFIISMF